MPTKDELRRLHALVEDVTPTRGPTEADPGPLFQCQVEVWQALQQCVPSLHVAMPIIKADIEDAARCLVCLAGLDGYDGAFPPLKAHRSPIFNGVIQSVVIGILKMQMPEALRHPCLSYLMAKHGKRWVQLVAALPMSRLWLGSPHFSYDGAQHLKALWGRALEYSATWRAGRMPLPEDEAAEYFQRLTTFTMNVGRREMVRFADQLKPVKERIWLVYGFSFKYNACRTNAAIAILSITPEEKGVLVSLPLMELLLVFHSAVPHDVVAPSEMMSDASSNDPEQGALLLSQLALRRMCAVERCEERGEGLQACSGCKTVYYCGRDHQVAHRALHKWPYFAYVPSGTF